MQTKHWKLKEPADEKAVLALADSLNVSSVLASLLINRGVTNFFEAKSYFRPSLESLHDPFLMDGMHDAAQRVIRALTGNEKICVYGDYDVDGTCSAALMYLFLKELGAQVETYIPNRLTEGYGMSVQSIDIIHQHGVKLIISVDCGITAVEEIEHGNTLGIDTVVCDHHQSKEVLPKAFAILDPIKPGCNYPFKFLSGAGVALKLASAVALNIGKKDMPFKYLDLVALAGAADIVSLTDENRILVREGLDLINANPRPGIAALIRSARMEPGNLSAGQVVFTIAPRVNAVGRLGDAQRAVELFTTDDPVKAIELARVLEDENTERRKIDEMTFSHAMSLLEETVDIENDPAIVLHYEDWHPGVIGIVASRMVEKFHRPTIMLTTIDGVAKGSARSVPGFNIYEALQNCEELLVQFGGHEAAAGLAIEIDKLDAFKKKFLGVLKNCMTEEQTVQEIVIDAKINLSEISPKFIRILDQFAPFGPGNMRPTFLSENVSLAQAPRMVGTNHIVTSFRQNGGDKIFDAIGFNLGSFVERIDKNKNLVDIVYTIESMQKDGKAYPQIRLRDIKIKENGNGNS
jgi:single-stranded-DNA-specific exonuclease